MYVDGDGATEGVLGGGEGVDAAPAPVPEVVGTVFGAGYDDGEGRGGGVHGEGGMRGVVLRDVGGKVAEEVLAVGGVS